MAERKIKAAFVQPMLLLKTEQHPEGYDWLSAMSHFPDKPVYQD